MRNFNNFSVALLSVFFLLTPLWVSAGETLLLSTTTSTENSGLLGVLLPVFEKETGIHVKVLPKGTGAALRDGMDGNADVLLVHAKAREEKFVSEGYGAYRLGVMHNDFVIVGPASDPAGVRGTNAVVALVKVAGAGASFVSRGDDSGTHTKEQSLWKRSGVKLSEQARTVRKRGKTRDIRAVEPENGAGWYFSIGQGMGRTLGFADEKRAYTLTDRGTYLSYRYGRKDGIDLEVLVEGDPALFNPYGVIPVSPKKHPHVKFEQAVRFARWLVLKTTQQRIASFRIQGQQAFFPDALQ